MDGSKLPKSTNRQLRDYEASIADAEAQLQRTRAQIVEDISEKEAELIALNSQLTRLDRTLHRAAPIGG